MNNSEELTRFNGDKVRLCLIKKDEESLLLYTKWLNDEKINMWIGHNYRNDTYKNVVSSFSREQGSYNYMYNIVRLLA